MTQLYCTSALGRESYSRKEYLSGGNTIALYFSISYFLIFLKRVVL